MSERELLQLKPIDVEAITPKMFPSIKWAMYIVPRHAKLIYDGEKTLIIKAREYKSHIDEPLFLIDNKLAYGIIYLQEPKEISIEEFKSLRDRHRITDKELEEWWGKRDKLYAYEFKFVKFPVPKPIRAPKGAQTFVKASNIKFLTPKDMTPIELEYYHSYYHSCAELMSPCCYEHFKIAREMLSRGIEHVDRTTCDRVVALLIKGWIEDYDPKKMNDRQLADDYRICLAYYSSIKQGKTIYKHVGDEKKPITLEDCKALALKIFKEMIRRGFTFNRPSKYKKYARELFEWLIKQVGEDKVKFKDELMDVSEIEYISPEYVSKLTDEELIELWKLLVKLAEEVATKPEDIPESIENPAIIVGNEMLKRGLWFLHSGDNILAEAVGLEVPEYPTPAGTFLSEPENVDLNTVLNLLPSNIVIDEQPYAAYLCGRIVNEGSVPKGHDIDILFRQLPDIRVVKKLKSIKPKWLADKLHIFYDPHGPLIGLSVPLFYYGFYKVPKEEMIRGFGPYRASLSKEKLKVGKPVVALKPASGFQKHEWWDTKESWLDWAHQHIEHGLFIEEKADGRRMQAHVDLEKGIVKLFTEDRRRDRSKALKPVMDEIVDILKKKGHKSVILDGEIVVYELPPNVEAKTAETKKRLGKHVPREDTASITTGKVDPKFWNGLVYIIYDILYLDGEELVDKPYKERRKIYTELIPKRAKYLIPIPGEEAKTIQDYFRLVEKYRRIPGSEGVVVKRSDSTYPVKYKGENRTKLWGKIKNLKSIDLMVWDVIEKKTKEGKPLGQYMYIVAFEIPKEKADMFSKSRVVEYKGKTYCIIGRTYATSVKCKRGDIVTVMPIRIRKYTDKEGKIYYTFMFPYFKEKRTDKKEPDTLTIVERIARAGTAPLSVLEESDELSYEIVIDLPECEFANDKAICPLKRIFGRRRDFEYDSATELSEYTLKIQYLKYPIACPLAYIRRCVYVRPYYYGYRTYKRMSLYDEDSLELLDEVYEDEC